MAKCTGTEYCPMQVGYKVSECDYKDCLYRTEPITNADRIRAMTDDELAELFGSIVDNGMSCQLICGNFDECVRNNSIERICKNHYLKWLQQPAEGESHNE